MSCTILLCFVHHEMVFETCEQNEEIRKSLRGSKRLFYVSVLLITFECLFLLLAKTTIDELA